MKRLRFFRLKRPVTILFATLFAVVSLIQPTTTARAVDTEFFSGNDILFYDPTCSTSDSGSSTLVDGDNIKKAFFYFTGKGLTAAQAAGIVGNLIQESGVNPQSVQKGGPGRGIAQWSEPGRWDNLKKWAGSKDINQLATQLDFMWYEMTEVSPWKLSLQGSTDSQYPSLKAITGDSQDAAIKAGHSFGYLYERFGVAGARDKFAGDVWTKYHSQVSGGTSSSSDSSSGSCADAASVGTCQNAPAGWVQDTNKVVDIACQEWNKKVVEDAGSNCDKAGNITKYAKAVGFSSCGEAWCGMFVGYVYKTAGYPFPGSAGVALVSSLRSYLKSIDAWNSNVSSDPKPGDIVTYNDADHTGIVVGVQGKYVTTIEGNTGADSQDKVNTSRLEGVHMHHTIHPNPGWSQDGWGSFDTVSKKQAK